jgi:nitrogenase molybdenum-cofactor synthesis protein NifE
MGYYRYYYPLGLASMAAVLREAGHHVAVYDAEHLEWLKRHAPAIRVFTTVHPSMKNVYGGELEVDLAVGFDAGYFCGGTKTVPLTLDSQPYGYRGAIRLLREMRLALENPQSHREQMYAAGLVI